MHTYEKNLMQVDMNLLVVFMVLFRELSVSRAAEHLSVGQPAVSGSLVRLRNCFDDRLFVRCGRGIRPTEKALQIAEALTPAMSALGSVIDGLAAGITRANRN
ncbi:LysR family transcriptional regulator [Pseudomonas sp. NPDC087358]|uniref:LysR family transcriptional regulator n=1 Tax=Pseudomonas sp. NPDC087358 TaxID=3364439 RepID=UPI00384DC4BD